MNPFFAAEGVPLGKTDQGHLQGFGGFNVFSSWDALCAVLVLQLSCSAVGVTQSQCSVVTLQSLSGAWFVSHLGLRTGEIHKQCPTHCFQWDSSDLKHPPSACGRYILLF